MGTSKRERQRANRQRRLEQIAIGARRRRTRRRWLQFAIGVPALVALVFGLARWFASPDPTPSALNGTGTSTSRADASVPCPPTQGSVPHITTFAKPPPNCLDAGKTYTALVTTNFGAYTMAFDSTHAPLTVNNFVYLARYHFFDNTICHRVVPNFVIQCGDPTGTGSGGPGYTIPDELPAAGSYTIGSVVMANQQGVANSGSSQFFVITGAKGEELPPSYSLFGHVDHGLDTIASISALGTGDGPPTRQVVIQSVVINET